MIEKIPYNAGEYRRVGNRNVFIAGHIWWPVEKRNAYHCVILDKDNNLTNTVEYIWDTTDGKWPLVEKAA